MTTRGSSPLAGTGSKQSRGARYFIKLTDRMLARLVAARIGSSAWVTYLTCCRHAVLAPHDGAGFVRDGGRVISRGKLQELTGIRSDNLTRTLDKLAARNLLKLHDDGAIEVVDWAELLMEPSPQSEEAPPQTEEPAPHGEERTPQIEERPPQFEEPSPQVEEPRDAHRVFRVFESQDGESRQQQQGTCGPDAVAGSSTTDSRNENGNAGGDTDGDLGVEPTPNGISREGLAPTPPTDEVVSELISAGLPASDARRFAHLVSLDEVRALREIASGPKIRNPVGYLKSVLTKGREEVVSVLGPRFRPATDSADSDVSDVGDAERSLGTDLVREMKTEYRTNRTAGLIRRYGIPLTAALFGRMKPDLPLERIAGGIEELLNFWLERDDLEIIWDVARRSIASSPHPDWFPPLDWRERLAPIWEASHAKVKLWWCDEDYGGRPYAEYEDLHPSRDRAAVVCGDGAPAEIEDDDGTPRVSCSGTPTRADLVPA